MTTPKLTKRQLEVIRMLTATPGRRLVLGKGGYLNPVERDGSPVSGVRGVAPIVADALTRHALLHWGSLMPSTLAIELFAEDPP